MKALFDSVSFGCSRLTTKAYSTSFSLGIYCLDKKFRDPIYSVYGFVRFADEIVDTFHAFNKAALLEDFKQETYKSIAEKISLNPILNSFQHTVHTYGIENELIDQFLNSMEMDLQKKSYDDDTLRHYVLGSAEVVGLMCLRVFSCGDNSLYEALRPYAMRLGAAFQKVNFLRDLKADYYDLGRRYFPQLDLVDLADQDKQQVERTIEDDFTEAFKGIKMLPRSSRFGVYVAYVYYKALFKKIKNVPFAYVMNQRIRIRNRHKATLLALSFVKHQLNMI